MGIAKGPSNREHAQPNNRSNTCCPWICTCWSLSPPFSLMHQLHIPQKYSSAKVDMDPVGRHRMCKGCFAFCTVSSAMYEP
jgi:hypothetical protein